VNGENLKKKLKDSEIKADKTAPRGKVIVEDEEGFKYSPRDAPGPKPKKIRSLADLTDDDLLDDTKLSLAGFGNIDDLVDDEPTTEIDSDISLLDLLKDDEEGKNVMSAIDAILDGNYDSIVMDRSKLQGLTLDDILG